MRGKRKILVPLLLIGLLGIFFGGFSVAMATQGVDITDLLSSPPQAITYDIKVDVSDWTQTEKNYIQAAAVAMLYQAGITYDSISVFSDPAKPKEATIHIVNASGDASKVLTTKGLKSFIDAELERSRIATAEAQAEAQARELELTANEFTDIKLADIDAKIDAIQDIDQMKAYLKVLVRYIIASQ